MITPAMAQMKNAGIEDLNKILLEVLKMNPVVHFEMPAQDRKRMADFYTKAFGWKTQQLGEDMGNYVLATTTDSDENGMPNKPGAINGGFFQKTDDKPAQYPSVVIAVDNIKEHMTNVEKSGGKVLGEPMNIPGIGLYVSFFDTEGNRVGMIQPTR
jgi:predicted enzyme related to lactoylglutathione lyase